MIKVSNVVTTNFIQQWDQKLLFEILDRIHDVVLVLDSDTTVVYANEAYAKILGVPVQKVLGRMMQQIEPNAVAIEVLRTGVPIHGRSYLQSIGIDIAGSTFPLFEGKNLIGCVCIFNNLSEIVRLTRELQLTQGVAKYLQEQLSQFEPLPYSFNDYVGKNSRLRETLNLAAKVAKKSDSSVLIRGESGVGKEVLANAIHNCSRRKDRPLIKVNCAAIPENLLESELFGYEEGAFTGAKKGGKLGKFELAHGGTIFLDEIGDMSITMQAKLLRVLQEREFERVGGTKTIKVDIRVIAATNRDLEQMTETGAFRRDLYYRLNVVPLFLLPLRERKDDIPALVASFLKQLVQEIGCELAVSPETMRILHAYEWPGNIRELHNALEHASIVCDGKTIEIQHLPGYLLAKTPKSIKGSSGLKNTISQIERDSIMTALNACDNNRTSAMKALGIPRTTFYKKMREYNIKILRSENRN